MKKWFERLAAIGCLLGLQACYGLGLDALPGASAADWRLKICEGEPAVQAAEGVRWQLSEMGAVPEVVTERNLLGRITRYVQPFTAHTVVFALSIENTSAQTLWLQPEQMTLHYSEKTEKALDSTFFEANWPTAAVRSPQHMLDRSKAMAEVYRSLLRARPVLPGESYQGRLAFRRHRFAPQVLQIHDQLLGQKNLNLQFCLTSSPSQP
ncbi:MAG: hypothetical protein IGS03_14800 [Candidatus Sericytochromatia bacterium]|nr:hypothetical protein [Candidatus Sericytochromatia bacterium]